jgi:hypothetical protein
MTPSNIQQTEVDRAVLKKLQFATNFAKISLLNTGC